MCASAPGGGGDSYAAVLKRPPPPPQPPPPPFKPGNPRPRPKPGNGDDIVEPPPPHQQQPPPRAVVQRRPPPPAAVLGRPKVTLPFSQMTLGRTTPPWYATSWRTEACELVRDEEYGEVLRVRYPRRSGTPSNRRGPPGGAGFSAAPRCLPATDVTLEYRVRFADNFQWSNGGKLLGLAIGEGPAGGGERSARAASCRLMWQREGGVIAYVYAPAGARQPPAYQRELGRPSTKYGDGLFKSAMLQMRRGGRWNAVVIRLKLNTFDENGRPRGDGVLTLSINGRAASLSGIVWRRFPDVLINRITFSTFFGGTWTSPTNTHADFAGFSVVA